MRKIIISVLCILLLSSSMCFAYTKNTSNNLLEKVPLFGTRPWEQDLQEKKLNYKEIIKQECEKQQKLIIKKEKLAKLKALERKRKKEEAERKAREEAEARTEEERLKTEQQKWEYFENKDYKINQSSTAKEKAAALIEYAKDHLGCRYVYGGSSWAGGVDCSGFTMLCYRKFGVSLPHYSGDQANYGKNVPSLSEAAPGDIICYYGHVGLYLGNNAMIHASSPSTGVIITHGVHYRPIKCIRRIFYK